MTVVLNLLVILIALAQFTSSSIEVVEQVPEAKNTCLAHWKQWNNWTPCTEGIMSRQRVCVCEDGTIVNPAFCSGSPSFLDNIQTEVCGTAAHGIENFNSDTATVIDFGPTLNVSEDVNIDIENQQISNLCRWRWNRWTHCNMTCGGGLTSRSQFCWCSEGVTGRCDPKLFIANQTTPCNEHKCGDTSAHNKLYWEEQHSAYFRARIESTAETWPYPNPLFNCTESEDPLNPKSNIHWMDVLHEIVSPDTPNREWTYLAKEYVAANLNVYHGYNPDEEGQSAINDATQLLADCSGYSSDVMERVYATKEKLSRLNNNIGGLSSVDAEFGLEEQGVTTNGRKHNDGIYLGMVIAGPIMVFVLFGVIAFLVVKRRKLTETSSHDAFDDSEETPFDDDDEVFIPPTPTPLHLPRVAERGRPGIDEDSYDSSGEDT